MKLNRTPEPTFILSPFWREQQLAFTELLAALSPNPTARHANLAMALETVQVESNVTTRGDRGRPPHSEKALARSFVVKSLARYPTTKALVQALEGDEALRIVCGFRGAVPSEATFSRAFARFARAGLGDAILARLAQETLGKELVTHVARDSTAIRARERPISKAPKEVRPRLKPGRKKGVPVQGKPATRQERQLGQEPEEAIRELPRACNVGTKRNSKGHDEHWVGYKFHVDVTADGVPISAVTTSASVHDSQVAIPLMKLTAQRTMAVCYQLMDSGYVGKPIVQAAEALEQVPIIAPKGTTKAPATPLDPARQNRFALRTAVERFFSDLKDNRGGACVRVRGHAKVHLHLLFGLLAIFALKLLAG